MYILGIIFSSSVKNAIGILIGIALNLQIPLYSMGILMMLILPIHEQDICFYLFVRKIQTIDPCNYMDESKRNEDHKKCQI